MTREQFEYYVGVARKLFDMKLGEIIDIDDICAKPNQGLFKACVKQFIHTGLAKHNNFVIDFNDDQTKIKKYSDNHG